MSKVSETLTKLGIYPGQQQEALKESLAKTHGIVSETNGNSYWGIYDSPLNGRLGRTVPADEFYSFNREFEGVVTHKLPSSIDREQLKAEIEALLWSKKGEAIGLEIGGPGRKVFEGFSKGFFNRTFGAELDDVQHKYMQDLTIADNHTIVGGVDAFTPEGIDRIRRALPGGKADLILERMVGPLAETEYSTYPRNLFTLLRIASDWYTLLKEGGVLYAELPKPLYEAIKVSHYKEWLRETFGEKVSIQIAQTNGSYTMRMIKGRGAPESLPLKGILDFIHDYQASLV